MLDLKHLLREAKQKIPPFLAAMQSENEKYLDIGGKKKDTKQMLPLSICDLYMYYFPLMTILML